MVEYTECDQCIRKCPVDQLQCANGRKRYFEVTGKEYEAGAEAPSDLGAAYRRKIRERRARKNRDQSGT